MPIRALTIDALWAWAILAGHKTVENRTWTTPYRGRIAIHAGRNASRDGDALRLLDRLEITPPDGELLQDLRGRVLGTVDLVACAEYHSHDPLAKNPFATGPWCWILAAPRWLAEPVAITGQLGLWTWSPTADVLTREGTPPCLSKPNLNLYSTPPSPASSTIANGT